VAIAITVPRLGWSMDEGTFVAWLRQDGDHVRPGDVLFVLESDKAAEEIAAIDAGILRLSPDGPRAGDRVKVGQVLAHLVAEGESAPTEVLRARSASKAAELATPSLTPAAHPLTPSRRPASSPRARRAAAELGIDWKGLPGTGRNGRIRERDVRAAAAGPGDGPLIPHTAVRRTIAVRMVAGVTQAAPVTLTRKVDATNLVNLHRQFQATAGPPDEIAPTYTDVIVKLTAVALKQHPLLQAQWRDDGLFVPNRIDIALAVDTEAGLLVPVVRAVDQLTLRQVAARTRELIAQARAGQLTADQMRDATFTVSNLGGLGIDAFTPILHLPQCAVLGVGRIVREPAVHDDKLVPRDALTLSLTFDHRVVDGAPAARFLATLSGCLENPAPRLVP
jgi:pyruvate dehydrogenase E2 component (dihydrolipoamide acetyltransferase)